MLTAKQAYEIFKKRFPNAETETIFDWGDFITCSQYADGGVHDDEWKIDRKTGELVEMDFLEHIEELKKHDEEQLNEIKVKDLK